MPIVILYVYNGVNHTWVRSSVATKLNGYTMAVDPSHCPYEEIPYGNPIDRHTLTLPEIMIDSFSIEIVKAMKSIFDGIWNAAGWPESKYIPSH